MGASTTNSIIYRFAIDRIYRKIANGEFGAEIVEKLQKKQNKYKHSHYIRIVGIAGIREAIPYLKDYINPIFEENPSSMDLIMTSAKSLGAIGEPDVIPFLENNLGRFSQSWQNSSIVYGLYLLNGKKYNFVNGLGNTQAFIPLTNNKNTFNFISKLGKQKRSYKDMVTLDRLMYPNRSELFKSLKIHDYH